MVAIEGSLPARHLPRFRLDGELLLLLLVGAYVLFLCLLPLLRLFAEAFLAGEGLGAGFVAEVWSSRAAQRATWNTLEASLGATLVSLLLGGAMALLLGLTDLRGKTVLVFLLLLPLLIPPQISALAWLELIGPQSPLRTLLGLGGTPGTGNPLYGREGIVLVMGIEHAPLVFLALRAGLRALPRDLAEAARAAGARPPRVLLGVVLPLLAPAILAGAALAFVSAIGNFGVPALLGIPGRYPMLTTLIYQRLNGFGPSVLGEVAALALILALLAAAGLALQALALRRAPRGFDRSGGLLGAAFSLGRRRPAVEAAVWTLMTVIAVLPLLALASAALVPAVGVRLSWESATLRNLVYVLTELSTTRRAFLNSTLLAGGAALATAAVALPLAWLLVSRRSRAARGLDLLADAPYALPGIVLSIAFILVLLPPPPILGVSLYNTLWILLLAYMARFLALSLRPAVSGLQQLEPALEEAAQAAGAGPLHRLRTVVLPLVAPAIGAGALLVFLAAFSELTVSALLWSRGNETVGVVVFSLYDEGNSTAAAAVALLTLVFILAVAGLAGLCARRLPRGVLPWQA